MVYIYIYICTHHRVMLLLVSALRLFISELTFRMENFEKVSKIDQQRNFGPRTFLDKKFGFRKIRFSFVIRLPFRVKVSG